MTKKILAILFVISICMSSCFMTASATTPDVDTAINDPIVYRFMYTNSAGATIRRISSTCVQCSSEYVVFGSYKITLYCNLQEFYNNVWGEFMTYYKDFDNSEADAISRIYTGLTPGCSYRTHTIVEVRNLNDTLLEVVNCYSKTVLM